MTLNTMSPILANAAIYFHDEGYRTDQPKLMGRHAAGEGFLKGFLAHAEIDELVAYAESEAAVPAVRRALRRHSAGATPACPRPGPGPAREAALAGAGTLMLPGPNARRVWPGAAAAAIPRRWSICGVTHTTASHRVMDGFGELLTGAGRALGCRDLHLARRCCATIEQVLDDLWRAGWRSGWGRRGSRARCCR